MRRGEIWWAEIPALVGRRPVVLLSRNEAYAVRDLVIVALITSRIRASRPRWRSAVPMACRDVAWRTSTR